MAPVATPTRIRGPVGIIAPQRQSLKASPRMLTLEYTLMKVLWAVLEWQNIARSRLSIPQATLHRPLYCPRQIPRLLLAGTCRLLPENLMTALVYTWVDPVVKQTFLLEDPAMALVVLFISVI